LNAGYLITWVCGKCFADRLELDLIKTFKLHPNPLLNNLRTITKPDMGSYPKRERGKRANLVC